MNSFFNVVFVLNLTISRVTRFGNDLVVGGRERTAQLHDTSRNLVQVCGLYGRLYVRGRGNTDRLAVASKREKDLASCLAKAE